MRRTISSAQTFFLKVLFPVIGIGVFAGMTILLFARVPASPGSSGALPPATRWILLLATIAGSAVIYWACIRLKRVDLDRRALYISNYLTEITVPLRDVVDITENRWVNPNTVTIRLRRDLGFGTRIVFTPTVRWFAFSPHPIVAELRAAVEHARPASDDDGA